MSSATSIDRAAASAAERESAQRDTFKPWHFFVLASLITATAAVVLARQSRPEHLVMISLIIGAAGYAAAAFYRALVPLVGDASPLTQEPLSESTRGMLEREKQLALRAIKELEFDRAMGKVAPKDFEEMAGRLRARAMMLMKQLDAEAGVRELIERDLAARLRAAGRTKGAARASSGQRPAAAGPSLQTCACGTANDADATFCKRCGTKLAGATPS